MNDIRRKKLVIASFFWRYFERTGAQLVKLVVEIILARLLEPGVFGTVALVTVFTNILEVFIDSGFGTALIQKKEPDDLDYSTVFYFNIIMCFGMYVMMFFLSPFVARFYGNPELVPIIRVISITLIVSGFKNVQQSYVSKNLQFKKFFYATLGGTIGAAVVGIAMAYLGFGIWALVAQSVINPTLDTIILWFAISWKPKRVFSFERLRNLFDYGWKLLVGSIIYQSQNEIQQLIIGRAYTPSDLAYYNRGKVFPTTIVSNIDSSINSVLLPVFSAEQDNIDRVRSMMKRSIKLSTFIIAPLILGLAATGDAVVHIVLGEKWMPCVPFLRIFCIIYMFYPIHTVNLSALRALGRSDITLSLGILKTTLSLGMLMVTYRFGVMAIAYGQIALSVLSQLINTWPNRKLMSYSYLEQIMDILPNIFMAGLMAIIVYSMRNLPINSIVLLFVQVMIGAVIYLGVSLFTKNDSFMYILKGARSFMGA